MSNDDNKVPPKFEFSGAGGFSVGAGQAGEDENAVTAGVENISLQVAAPAPESEAANEDDDEDDEDDGALSGLGAAVLKRVTAIRRMHIKVEEIDLAYKAERLAMEKKFLAQKQLLLDARNRIIAGEEEPPEDPSAPDVVSSADEEGAGESKGIPGFWLACLLNHPAIGELIQEEDVPALEALADIKCDYSEDYTSFTLSFCFRPNDFFSNSTLTKKYVVSPDLLDDKAPALSDCIGSDIDWKEGKNLCVTEVKKKQKAKSGRSKGQVRTVITTQPKHSFFHYFGNPMTDEEAEEEEENGNEEEDPIKLTMEEDYDIGHAIRTSVIPEAVLWYTGEAIDDEDEDGDEGDDDDDDDDDEEDDDEDEDEDDEPPKAKGKDKKGGRKQKKGALTFTQEGGFAAPGGGAGGEQPECKQN